jgi:peptide/nickel transport system substrate-binding protein
MVAGQVLGAFGLFGTRAVDYALGMRFQVLGPLEVEADDGPVVLGGPKERLLLAQLLTRPNQVVPVETLVRGLWGEQPPPTASKTLQSHVKRLRRALEPGRAQGAAGEVLVTREPGYLLRVAPGALDAARFEQLTAQARRALSEGQAADDAAALLREALGLWRGQAFEEFLGTDVGAAESDRLAELRLGALEDRIEADLRLGRHRELVAELEGLARDQPLRERLWAQLMLALYRSGRQADALLAYQRARKVLVEELGIDPGAELRRLQLAILAQDPGLDLPTPVEADPSLLLARGQQEAAQVLGLHETVQASRAATGAEEQAPRQTAGSRSRLRLVQAEPADVVDLRESGGEPRVVPADSRRSRWRLVMAGALVAVLVATALVANRIGNRGSGVPAIAANSLGLIQGKSNALVGQVPLEVRSGQVAAGEGAVWVASEDGTVSRVDAATRRVVQRISVGRDPAGVAAGGGAVWVANSGDRSVSWINPSTNPVGNGPTGIALGEGAVWVANSLDNSVYRIDPDTGNVGARIEVAGTPSGVVAGLGAVWVTNATDGTVSRISPSSNTVVRSIPVGNGPRAIAVGADAVWVANSLDATVSRIDPASDTVMATVGVGDGPSAVAVSPGAVWAASEGRGTVARLDPDTNTVVRRIDVGSAPAGAAVVGDALWVVTGGAPSSHRGGVLKLIRADARDITSLDPALWDEGSILPAQVRLLTNDGLVGHKQVGGVEGSALVANLATTLPRPTDGGMTYTFQLRSGIRYSTGQEVTPEDVRSSIERGFKMESAIHRRSFRGLVGADACSRSPATCRLSKGIVTDPSANTVTFHLTRPDPNFLVNLAQPTAFVVPAETPSEDVGTRALPATGPYMVQTFAPKQRIVAVRNPQFREWSRAAQPDGYPGTIEWILASEDGSPIDQEAAVNAVQRGQADYYDDQPPDDRIDELITRYTSQTHRYPFQGSFLMYLNTHVPPFDDPRVRRAISYAVDRRAVQDLYPGPAEISCQLLPPNFPGYQPYCPYTLDPSPAGAWTAPDRATAARLIKESGTSGMKVTVWAHAYFADLSRYFVRLLDKLGYRARLRIVGDNTQAGFNKFFYYLNDSRNKAQMGAYWTVGFPSPAEATSGLRCAAFVPNNRNNINTSQFCSHALEGKIERALSLQTTDPAKAGAAWAAVDRQIADQAPAIGLLVPQGVDLVSKRVGNYQNNPVWGIILSQLWVV